MEGFLHSAGRGFANQTKPQLHPPGECVGLCVCKRLLLNCEDSGEERQRHRVSEKNCRIVWQEGGWAQFFKKGNRGPHVSASRQGCARATLGRLSFTLEQQEFCPETATDQQLGFPRDIFRQYFFWEGQGASLRPLWLCFCFGQLLGLPSPQLSKGNGSWLVWTPGFSKAGFTGTTVLGGLPQGPPHQLLWAKDFGLPRTSQEATPRFLPLDTEFLAVLFFTVEQRWVSSSL